MIIITAVIPIACLGSACDYFCVRMLLFCLLFCLCGPSLNYKFCLASCRTIGLRGVFHGHWLVARHGRSW
jgi:hypothetical protein